MNSEEPPAGVKTKTAAGRFREALGFERNVVVMSLAVFLLGAGEELWKSFLPRYLQALGASVAASVEVNATAHRE